MMSHTWPLIVPGGGAVVFVTSTEAPRATGQLAALKLDTGEVTRLGLAGLSPHYAPTGHLVYAVEDGALRAVPLDATSLRATGTPVSLVDGVLVNIQGAAQFSISDNGWLVYASGGVVPGQPLPCTPSRSAENPGRTLTIAALSVSLRCLDGELAQSCSVRGASSDLFRDRACDVRQPDADRVHLEEEACIRDACS